MLLVLCNSIYIKLVTKLSQLNSFLIWSLEAFLRLWNRILLSDLKPYRKIWLNKSIFDLSLFSTNPFKKSLALHYEQNIHFSCMNPIFYLYIRVHHISKLCIMRYTQINQKILSYVEQDFPNYGAWRLRSAQVVRNDKKVKNHTYT